MPVTTRWILRVCSLPGRGGRAYLALLILGVGAYLAAGSSARQASARTAAAAFEVARFAKLDGPFDGVWVGVIDTKTSTGRRPYPILMNLSLRDAGGEGLLLLADELHGNPSKLDFLSLGVQAKGKKLTLNAERGEADTAEQLVAKLRLRGDALKGTLVSSDKAFSKSRVEMRRLDPDEPLQHLWSGSLPDAPGAPDRVALTLWLGEKIGGGGFVGDAFGKLTNATLAQGRLTASLRTPAGDIDLDLMVDRKGRLSGFVDGRPLVGGPLAPGDTSVAPTIRKLKPASLPAGVTTTVTIKGKNLAPGFLVHSNVEGVYAGLPQVQSARKATVALTVSTSVAAGTPVQLSTAAANGNVSASKAKLKTTGVAGVSFDDNLLPIFVGTCAVDGCHVKPPEDDPAYPEGGEAAGGMDLSRSLAYGSTVNKPSNGRPELDRIEPFDVERSYLIKKLRGDPDIVGARMPASGPPYLSAEMIDMFIRWVEAGAPRN